MCDSFYGNDCMDAIGYPALQLAHWLIPTVLIVLFTPYVFLKRWLIFSGIFLLLSFYAISQTAAGPFYGKETIAGLLGILLLVITVIWLLIHLFISRRKKRRLQ